jgi:hypothetical protein
MEAIASVYQLLQHATTQEFRSTSVTPFATSTAGLKTILVVSPLTDNKHAAFTASQGLRPDRVYLDNDLTLSSL